MQAAVLAGGLGTRLRGVLGPRTPKPMAPVGGRPFLDLLLDQLVAGGVDDIVLLVGHRAGVIRDHVGDRHAGVPVTYSVETRPLGTGGALVHARGLLADRFLVVNGDTWLGVDLLALLAELHEHRLVLALAEVDDVGRFGAVTVAGRHVVALSEKGGSGPGLINGGVYAMRRAVIDDLADDRATDRATDMGEAGFSLETELLEARLHDLRPGFVVSTGPFFDIGVPDDYAAAARHLVASR